VNQRHRRPWGQPASSDPGAQNGAAFAVSRGLYRRGGQGTRVMVDTATGPRVAGVLVKDGDGQVVFRRLVRGDRHLLRLPEESWCFDEEVLAKAEMSKEALGG